MQACLILFTTINLMANAQTISFYSSDIQELGRSLSFGQTFEMDEIYLSEERGSIQVTLERYRVFAPDSRVILNTESGQQFLPVPKNVYLRGKLPGKRHSWMVLSILEDDTLRGLIHLDGEFWVLGGQKGSGLTSRQIGQGELKSMGKPYRCLSDSLEDVKTVDSVQAGPPVPEHIDGTRATYTAVLGIETDQEYLALFGGNTTDATNYAGDLIAYGSVVYESEVDTALVIGDLFLWSTTDPWTQQNAACGLYEFGRYWNDNRNDVSRTTAHFLSGKTMAMGIAWVGVLCRGAFNVNLSSSGCNLTPAFDNYGGAYGFSMGLDGSFDMSNPAIVWDVLSVSHEMGHNFSSPHTHCYGGIGGVSNPVDSCYGGECGSSGCWCGGTALPGSGSLTGGSVGGANGTIMSYCHLLTGGLSNITFTFGEGHPYGVSPERVANQMNAHVVTQYSLNPSCFASCDSPSITTQPDSQAVCTGENATFSVTAEGSDLNYQWRKDSVNLNGQNAATLSLNQVDSSDAGHYDCVVENPCGTLTSDSAVLTVSEPVSLTTQPASRVVCPGSNVTFLVAAEGSGTLTYQWYYNGEGISGANSPSYGIDNAQSADAGSYACVVSNTCGSVTSSTAQLSVVELAVNTLPASSQFCFGENAALTVEASGLGELRYQWRKNGSNLDGETAFTLQFTGAQTTDEGNYECLVWDDCSGPVTSGITMVTVGDQPLVVEQLIHVQGLSPETLEATICSGSSWEWENLSTSTVFGENQNPVTLPYLSETTDFEIRVDTQSDAVYSKTYRVLVSDGLIYADANGDGCNTIEDLLYVCPDWRTPGPPDVSGSQLIDILDFLHINMEQVLPCDPQ
ncbi:MAG: hypothetical protein CR997_00500 [Acidobacteria bacterium]|nr:MAG: hypothetical protein CR997_00500 [Acidobacteriota bacterium]